MSKMCLFLKPFVNHVRELMIGNTFMNLTTLITALIKQLVIKHLADISQGKLA